MPQWLRFSALWKGGNVDVSQHSSRELDEMVKSIGNLSVQSGVLVRVPDDNGKQVTDCRSSG